MSHNYNYDLGFLKQIVGQDFGYIGLLGLAQKHDSMLSDLQDQGIHLNESRLSKIHGPTGLDIGAENSTEIALSIVTEIKAIFIRTIRSTLKTKKKNPFITGRSVPNYE